MVPSAKSDKMLSNNLAKDSNSLFADTVACAFTISMTMVKIDCNLFLYLVLKWNESCEHGKITLKKM